MLNENHVLNAPFVEESKFSEKRSLYQLHLERYYNRENNFDFFEASEDIPVSLKDIYVPLRLAEKEISVINNSEEVEEIKGDEVYSYLNKHNFVALSGLAGSGKSTLTKYLATSLSASKVSQEHYNLGRRVVFPIILRELDFSKIDTFGQFLFQWLKSFSEKIDFEIDIDFFNYYIDNGWAIVVFDGFDELESSTSKALLSWIKKWVRYIEKLETKTKTNVIITARPTGFEESAFSDKLFTKLYIQPFNQKQIETFSKHFFKIRYAYDKPLERLKHDDFLEKLKNFTGLSELKHRPIYLAMLGFISETDGEIPDTRALAYEKITEAYVFLLDQKKRLDKEMMPTWNKSDKIDFLSEFAYRLHHKASADEYEEKKQLHIYTSKEEMLEIFADILKTSNFSSMSATLNVEAIADYFLARTGLLVEPKEGFVQFSHLSFQEYLVAKRIHRKQGKRNIDAYLKKEIFDNLDKVGWEEIAQLYFGIDSIRQDEGQEEIVHFLIEPNKISHCKFLYNFLLNSTNKLTHTQKEQWFNTLLFMLLRLESLSTLRSLVEELEEQTQKLDINLLPFVKQLFEATLEEKEVDRSIMISYVDKDDEEDLYYKLKKLEPNFMLEFQNILYIGFYFKAFREGYLTKALVDKLPTNTRGQNFPFLLDKYIPFNKEIKTTLATIVSTNITLLEFIAYRERGGPLSYSRSYTTYKLHIKIMQLYLFTLKKSLFLNEFLYMNKTINNNIFMAMAMDMDMAIGMAEDIDMDKAIDMAMATDMAISSDMDSDFTVAMAMTMMMTMDIARDITMAWDIDEYLYKKFLQFNLYASATLFAKEANIDLEVSKQELVYIVENPLSFFEEFSLSDTEKKELDEVLEKSTILPMLAFILSHTDYENFDKKDEERALAIFHEEIKAFNAKYKS